jgi:hypothetical protein
MSKVYRVYSDHKTCDRDRAAVESWYRDDIINIPVNDEQLSRSIDRLPFLKDLLDIAAAQCDLDDIIIYTNTDIGLVSDLNINFASKLFFCPRKQVNRIKAYSTAELETVLYEDSINCDCFGFTKQWYLDNRDLIPDFVIGAPKWDIAFLCLMDGAERLNNIVYHVKHNPNWKIDNFRESNIYNSFIFNKFIEKNVPSLIQENLFVEREAFFNYMSSKRGYTYLLNPVFISFYTPSHRALYNEIFVPSFLETYGDKHILLSRALTNQPCPTGTYHTQGWRITQICKLEHIIRVVRDLLDGQIFVFCDADIIHVHNCLDTIKEKLNSCDLVAQQAYSKDTSYGRFCSGFFAGKRSDRVLDFLKNIHQDLLADPEDNNRGDQFYFNINSHLINVQTLDDTFFNPGCITKGNVLETSSYEGIIDSLSIQTKIVHANYILSPAEKLAFLNQVKNKFSCT